MHKAITQNKFKVTQVSVKLNSVAPLHTLRLAALLLATMWASFICARRTGLYLFVMDRIWSRSQLQRLEVKIGLAGSVSPTSGQKKFLPRFSKCLSFLFQKRNTSSPSRSIVLKNLFLEAFLWSKKSLWWSQHLLHFCSIFLIFSLTWYFILFTSLVSASTWHDSLSNKTH